MTTAMRLIARREILVRLRHKSFLYSTAIALVLLAAVILVPKLLASDEEPRIAVTGVDPAALGEEFDVVSAGDADEAARLVREDDVELAVVARGDDVRLLVTDQSDAEARAAAIERLRDRATAAELRRQDVDVGALERAVADASPQVQFVEGDRESAQRRAIAALVSIVLFFQIFSYGIAVAIGVVEEKSSRVVELLLPTVDARQLLAGKVIGIGAVGLLQLSVFAAFGICVSLLADAVDVSSPALVGIVASSVGWFLLGYAFFAFVYGATGSLVSRQEEVQSATAPVSMLGFATYFATVYAAQDLSAGWVDWLSYVPPFSTLLMPVQMAAGGVGWVGVAVAAGLMISATAVLASIGSLIYERSVLRLGARARILDVLRAT
jgi:ABC-2 type transport system permease protein